MPWKETDAMNEKVKFISAWLTKEYSISELCRNFGISRPIAYKIINRYEAEGVIGLKERSRAHHTHPQKTNDETVALILKVKSRYPQWGPRKIRDWLDIEYPDESWPAASTIGDHLKKHGVVKEKKKRKKTPPHSQPFINCTQVNEVWSADFKGQFKLGNEQLCYPLTISDNYSRYLIECRCLPHPTYAAVRKYFEGGF